VRGLVLMAPHFFTEDMGIAEIARAREAYSGTDLRARLARWHDDVDNAFRGWNDAWLDPDFRKWDLTGELPTIRVPVLVVQGEADQYGTVAQVEAVQRLCGGSVEVTLLPGARHSPHRDAPQATLEAVARFATRVLGGQSGEEKAGRGARKG
jgi:pimeloyl-ACP methyl ester carboxylesterase